MLLLPVRYCECYQAGDSYIFKRIIGWYSGASLTRGTVFLSALRLITLVVIAWPVSAQAELRVVATIPPLHSLASSVLKGVASPDLLIKGARSPHDFTLRPSDVGLLESADLILRIDPGFETGLNQVISRLGGKVPVISWMGIDGVKLLRFRGSKLRSIGDHDSSDHGHDQGAASGMEQYDPHLWLDPGNAVVFARALAKTVGTLPAVTAEDKVRVRQNAEKLIARLQVLIDELEMRLAPFKTTPFLTYHDAYHYFEHRFGVNSLGSVASGAHALPGARHLAGVRKVLKSGRANCLFTEPQFPPKLAQRLTAGTAVRLATLDPLGAAIAPGAEQYFMLMRALGDDLANCLGASG